MRRPSRHRMNANHLHNPAFRERIAALWAERRAVAVEKNWNEEQLFLSCMRGTRAVDRCWGKRRAKEHKALALALRERLARAQLALEQSPDSAHLQTEVLEATEHLTNFDKEKATWVDQIIQDRWLADGDRGSKLFFKTFKGMSSAKHIPALKAADDSLTSNWDSMAEITVAFFQQILGETEPATNTALNVDINNPILDVVQDHLRMEEKESLKAPFTMDELGMAAKLMKKRKCPGPDGIPVEFF